MPAEISDFIVRQPSYCIKRAQSALRGRLDEAMRPLGITTMQWSVLNMLEAQPGLSNADLARLTFVKPQTMIGLLQGLETAGLVVRRKDPDHGRILQAALTDAGRRTVKAARAETDKVARRMLDGFAEKDAEALVRLLNQCIGNLER
jgi:DNA-binding MarR family transcriptional regulator